MRDPRAPQSEYESLRQELLAYTRQHFDMAVLVVTASTALFGYGFAERQGAIFLCAYLLLFLALSHNWTIGNRTLRIASYIRVFFETNDTTGWESRLARLRQASPPLLSGMPYHVAYWGIALTASTAGYFYLPPWPRFVFAPGTFLVWTALNMLVVLRRKARYAAGDLDYVKKWRSVLENEKEFEQRHAEGAAPRG